MIGPACDPAKGARRGSSNPTQWTAGTLNVRGDLRHYASTGAVAGSKTDT